MRVKLRLTLSGTYSDNINADVPYEPITIVAEGITHSQALDKAIHDLSRYLAKEDR